MEVIKFHETIAFLSSDKLEKFDVH